MFFRKKKVAAVKPETIPASVPAEPTLEGGPRKKILVVDDDPVVVKALSMTLSSGGYEVVSAADGAEAISRMRDEKPDMMLVDVSLPPDVAAGGAVPWNGFQVTRWLRMNSGEIPTIIISGTDKPEYKTQAAAVGADAFMAKPLNKAELLSSVESALANRHAGATEFVALKMAKN